MGREAPSTMFRQDHSGGQGGGAAVLLLIGGLLVATIMVALTFQLDNDLSQKSKEASDETIQSLGAGLEVVALIGERGPSGHIDAMDITVRAARGAQTSLTLLAIQITDGQERHSLLSGHAGEHQFGIVVVRDADRSTENATRPVLDAGDLARLRIDLAAIGFAMGPGETLTVRILPDEGLDTLVRARAPISTIGERFVSLE